MEINGEYNFTGLRQSVWNTFMDPDTLRAAIPGCQEFAETCPGQFKVTVKISIAAITGVYIGTISLQDLAPIDSYCLVVDGSGKAGRVQATAKLSFFEMENGTQVMYTADVKPQGAVARLGNRLIISAANLLIGQFFKGMESRISAAEQAS